MVLLKSRSGQKLYMPTRIAGSIDRLHLKAVHYLYLMDQIKQILIQQDSIHRYQFFLIPPTFQSGGSLPRRTHIPDSMSYDLHSNFWAVSGNSDGHARISELNQNNNMSIIALRNNNLQFLTTRICFCASKMQASSTQKTKDSAGRRLGIKAFGGEEVYPNDIIARQRGFKWKSGRNVIVGLDQTIHAKVEGKVSFRVCKERKVPYYFIDVIPEELPNRRHGPPSPYIYHPELFPERAAMNHPEIVQADKYHVKLKE